VEAALQSHQAAGDKREQRAQQQFVLGHSRGLRSRHHSEDWRRRRFRADAIGEGASRSIVSGTGKGAEAWQL
jgi:hypothetical protein